MIPPGCCPVVLTDTCASLHDPVDLAVSLVHTTLLVIIFHITERCLIRQRTDRSGTEGLSRTEDYFCIFMCLTLILTGEVQVDIRLFVSLESQESLKRNIKPHLSSTVFHTRGHILSGMSQPARPAYVFTSSESKSLIMAVPHSNNEDLTD